MVTTTVLLGVAFLMTTGWASFLCTLASADVLTR